MVLKSKCNMVELTYVVPVKVPRLSQELVKVNVVLVEELVSRTFVKDHL